MLKPEYLQGQWIDVVGEVQRFAQWNIYQDIKSESIYIGGHFYTYRFDNWVPKITQYWPCTMCEEAKVGSYVHIHAQVRYVYSADGNDVVFMQNKFAKVLGIDHGQTVLKNYF